ncbi:phosphonoacetaldehyde hydrolase [uncultured Desulfovibrio sp.]|uniref:phosphonoacetaldehyde hydrolase n=1 Tax=uncultured Desulfovibrio sp. TaxID=167968 RepID=UPI002636BE9C|nr:phosphonoacetaldehyde hydrolase [uncultured Desulfovibrio sp.]
MKPFLRRTVYTGPVQAVILDWAGTAVDHGCRGPVAVFSRAFERHGITPEVAEVRAPMGCEKRQHVQTMLAMPRLAELWRAKHGHEPDEAATDAVFATVQELMPETLADYATPVPGCVEAIAALRARGVRIGSCTGYSRDMMVRLMPRAEAAGYKPDAVVTADETPQGRPWPWMCYLNCMRLGVHPPEAVVKVGDTLADVEEGVNAGHWSVGVTRTSNALGLTAEEAAALPPDELGRREEELARAFREAGAHHVISSIADLPALVDVINARLSRGERP